MEIVNLFYNLARQHKDVKGFIYGLKTANGAGNEAFPLTHLDDPILGQGGDGNTLTYTCNVDITDIPAGALTVQAAQEAAFKIGLSYVERLKLVQNGYKISRYSFITLKEYYDNDAAGMRFTYNVVAANPANRCADDFDPTKNFPEFSAFPDFKTDHPEGCAVFTEKNGLPDFKIDQ